jgi:hypothetical protein
MIDHTQHARGFRDPGSGMQSFWQCMGCHKARSAAGAKGVGVKRRCAVCLAKKAAKEKK